MSHLMSCNQRCNMDYYMVVNCENSKDLHPSNTATDFVVELPDYIDTTNYKMGLCECYITGIDSSVYVYCDLLDGQDSVVHGKHLPLLRYISNAKKKGEIKNIYMMKTVKHPSLKRFRIYLTLDDLEPIQAVDTVSLLSTRSKIKVQLVLKLEKLE